MSGVAPGSVQEPVRRPSRLRRLVGLGLIYLAGAVAGWLCARLGIPLPWMVGPLFVAALVAVTRGTPPIPIQSRWAGQLVVASAVALNLTPAALVAMVSNLIPMALSAVAIMLSSGVLAAVVMRTSGVDRATALFASLPGGPVEMATLAERYGGRGGLVAFSQTLRIAAIVTLIPPLLLASGASFRDIAAQPTATSLPGLLLVLSLGLLGALALRRLRIANPFFLGPLAGVGLATVLGAPVAPIPGPLIGVAQVALGVSLGSMFDRRIIAAAGSFVVHGALITVLLIAISIGLAGLMVLILDQPFHLLVLANAPGSVTEMAVTAKGMSLDASFVTAYHIVRIFLIVPAAELVFRAFASLSRRVDRILGG